MKNTVKKTQKKHSHSKHFLKVYAPYLPVFVLVAAGLFGSILPQSRLFGTSNKSILGSVLAYATEMSVSGLLSATNSQRAANGLDALSINNKLNASAQAKAVDMKNRDYWAHTSPTGEEPWVFFDAAGYAYAKAGENLAYGFVNSSDTVTGWMNSPSHRANMLDSQYTEVGFGYINSDNFVGTGPETIIVAHYAKPTVAAASTQMTPTTPSSKTNTKAVTKTPAQEPVPEEIPSVVEEAKPEPVPQDRINQPYNSDTSTLFTPTESTSISLLQRLTNGNAQWSITALSVAALVVVFVWISKHAYNVKRILVDGELFVMHHPIIDVAVVSFVALAVYLTQTTGVIL
jgi:hypothetical protein